MFFPNAEDWERFWRWLIDEAYLADASGDINDIDKWLLGKRAEWIRKQEK